MGSFKIYRFAILSLAAALGASCFYFVLALAGVWAENEKLLKNQEALMAQIEALAREKAHKEEYFFRLLHDESFKERVVREKLGYAAPREIVFRFDDAKSPEVTVVPASGGAAAQ